MCREFILFITLVWPVALFANDTLLQFYRPYTETTHHPAAVIVAKKAGECWQQSQRIVREDAWRCSAEGKNYDPCFVKPFGDHLNAICPESPWTANSVQITVNTPLDNSNHATLDMSRGYPWAIELANGVKCQATDSGESYDDLPVRYRCNEQSVLFGHIQRCAVAWKMLQHNASGTSTVVIEKVWF